jgi:hypothetical protein
VFPELFDAFSGSIPWQDVTRRNGAQNFGAHFPMNGIPPDLGKYIHFTPANS